MGEQRHATVRVESVVEHDVDNSELSFFDTACKLRSTLRQNISFFTSTTFFQLEIARLFSAVHPHLHLLVFQVLFHVPKMPLPWEGGQAVSTLARRVEMKASQ